MQVLGLFQRVLCKLWDCVKEYFTSCRTLSKSTLKVVGLYQRVLYKLWDCFKEHFTSCRIVSKSIISKRILQIV